MGTPAVFVADVEKTFHRRCVLVSCTNDILRTPGRKWTSGKLSYGPKESRPIDVTSECDVLRTTLSKWNDHPPPPVHTIIMCRIDMLQSSYRLG